MKLHPLNCVAFALCLSFGVAASAQTMSKDEYKGAQAKIKADYKTALVPCDSLSGNAKKICVLEAKGTQETALADLDASNKPSAKTRREATDAMAEAVYATAKQRCQDLAGNAKDVCVKEAKSAEVAAKADAKLQQKTADANADAKSTSTKASAKASEKVSEARGDAIAEKTDAQYKVEKEKCDVLAGAAKDNCLSQAKARFAK